MGLYPNILFHFTDKLGLYDILEHTFKVSYAHETIEGENQRRELGIPMVSFCDLRLSELKEHIQSYGKFGIGMTKEWAFRNGLNPVLYLSKQSHFTDNFILSFDSMFKLLMDARADNFQALQGYNNLLYVYSFLKNYQGELIRKRKKTKPNYRFADEREWRYVPPMPKTDGHRPFISPEELEETQWKKWANERLNGMKLEFQPDDINYLIVPKDTDINPLINHLKFVKLRYNPETVEKLSSRILTVDQIRNDI